MKDLGQISRGRARRKGQDVQARSTAQWVGCDQNKRYRRGRVKDSWLWAEDLCWPLWEGLSVRLRHLDLSVSSEDP